jgi:hypothetical protein
MIGTETSGEPTIALRRYTGLVFGTGQESLSREQSLESEGRVEALEGMKD